MGVDSDNAIEHSCSLIHFTSRCFLARFPFSSPDLVRGILSSSGSLLFLIWFDSLGPINQLFVVLIFITSNWKEIMNYLQNVSLSLEWINIWEEWFAERGLFFLLPMQDANTVSLCKYWHFECKATGRLWIVPNWPQGCHCCPIRDGLLTQMSLPLWAYYTFTHWNLLQPDEPKHSDKLFHLVNLQK